MFENMYSTILQMNVDALMRKYTSESVVDFLGFPLWIFSNSGHSNSYLNVKVSNIKSC